MLIKIDAVGLSCIDPIAIHHQSRRGVGCQTADGTAVCNSEDATGGTGQQSLTVLTQSPADVVDACHALHLSRRHGIEAIGAAHVYLPVEGGDGPQLARQAVLGQQVGIDRRHLDGEDAIRCSPPEYTVTVVGHV